MLQMISLIMDPKGENVLRSTETQDKVASYLQNKPSTKDGVLDQKDDNAALRHRVAELEEKLAEV